MRRDSSTGVFETDRDSRGVATESSPVSSLSSSANESLLLASCFFFFFFGGASDGEALALRLENRYECLQDEIVAALDSPVSYITCRRSCAS